MTFIRENSLYASVEATTWSQAQSLAVQMGGNLAGISSQEEDTFIWNHFKNQELSTDGNNWGYWIGLQRDLNSDHTLSESWYWANGNELNYFNASFDPGNPSSEPNGGYYDLYTHVWGFKEGTHEEPLWNDTKNNGNSGVNSFPKIGVAELPLYLNIEVSDIPTEGAGVFTTSINLSAGSLTSGDLTEGVEVHWRISGITSDDLSSGSLEGSGNITDGKLSILHSLVEDNDSGESFKISVYSDAEKSEQIGKATEFSIEDSNKAPTETKAIRVVRENSLYANVDATTWSQAQSLAVQIGGNLAGISSPEEDAFIWNHFKNQELSTDGNNWGYWIGLQRDLNSDHALSESWYWANGDELNYFNPSFDPGNSSSEPNGGYYDLYTHVWGFKEGTHEEPLWNDAKNNGNSGVNSFPRIGVAELPLYMNIEISDIPTEGAGVFTTSINLSAGSVTSGNLAEGVEVHWRISGITSDDLSSGFLQGSGVISGGKLDIQHSLVKDDDSGESFEVSVYSDSDRNQQIRSTESFVITDHTPEHIDIPTTEPTSAPVDTEEDGINQVESIDDITTPEEISTFQLVNPIPVSGQDIETLIAGTNKKDKITGTSEGEVLAGGAGKDILKGGGGADGFLFNQSNEYGKKTADKIKDFNPQEGDSILMDKKVFGLGKKIKLKVVTGKKDAKKAVKRKKDFVYDDKKGLLYFNENGMDKGWGDGGLFAKLIGAPALAASDFTIV